ncbi:MAG: serine--tRNA ligase [Nitrososphaerota archaeon]|jgi:seryl-tRNA synthetase|nr:serine--tRNA ligase [Nitrososphaerota archaeon]MDG6955761.1 serine--tRNA ligase [Nitrososphaerota archaeon]MDG6957272.1 serine--tRNA ligase [Nitrososphaerota archaeon]MDG6959167.1 serine--tRNA ligase [Nitrososphaerota archaeon]MDG6968794.1 serine--tRNA ligase [Nitrososphaerota archaeon]
MLDVKLLRESPEVIRADLRKRGMLEKLTLVDDAVKADAEWRSAKAQAEALRHELNEANRVIADLARKKQPIQPEQLKVAEISKRLDEFAKVQDDQQRALEGIMMALPNILHESVPVGKDDTENVTVRAWGDERAFDFEPKDHIEVLAGLGMVDMERAAKISGARFFFLKGDAVKLEHAIMRYAMDVLSAKGFTPVEPPFMMRREPYGGVTDLNDFGPVIYKVEGEDLYMIATSEHPLVAMHSDEIVQGADLPLKYCGFSPCFRVEAGAHGKDTKGIFRTHQFYKVEQIAFARPEESWPLHEQLIANAEEIFRSLGLRYRVVNVCTGDMGTVAAKKYDLEAWMPVQGRYREMVSCSNCTDYQSRRLKIRFRDKQSEATRLVHTLNSTAVTTRVLVAIVENFQQSDGTVKIPEVLLPYMGGVVRLQRR